MKSATEQSVEVPLWYGDKDQNPESWSARDSDSACHFVKIAVRILSIAHSQTRRFPAIQGPEHLSFHNYTDRLHVITVNVCTE